MVRIGYVCCGPVYHSSVQTGSGSQFRYVGLWEQVVESIDAFVRCPGQASLMGKEQGELRG